MKAEPAYWKSLWWLPYYEWYMKAIYVRLLCVVCLSPNMWWLTGVIYYSSVTVWINQCRPTLTLVSIIRQHSWERYIIAPLGMLHLVYGINSPLISASLVRHSLLLFLLSHMAVHHLYLLHYHRLHHLLLAQNFILNSRLGSSAILSSVDLFLFYRTDYTDSRPMLNGCTGKCVRLSRPLVGFWTHFKSLIHSG